MCRFIYLNKIVHALYRAGVEDGAAQAEALREFMQR